MPWVKRILRTHYCPGDGYGSLPDPREVYNSGVDLGSIYICDKQDCRLQWRLADSQQDGLCWEKVKG